MRSLVLAVCCSLIIFALPVRAAEQPWDAAPFSAEPKAMLAAAEAVPAGDAEVVVLLDEMQYIFGPDGRSTSHWRLVFRVLDDSAVENWATVETEWAPWYHDRPDIAARVIGKDGSVHTLDAKAITESAARDESPDIFTDNRLLRAPLPGMATGAVIEQVITYRDHNPLFETGTAGRMKFGRFAPVETTRLVIDAPAELPIRYVNKSSPRIEPLKTESDGRQRVVFASGRIEPLEDLEWNLPYDESNVPYVAFSTGTSWQVAAQRYFEIVEKQLGDPAAVQGFLRSAIGKTTDPREIVKKSLAAIQKNIRYAGMEVGEGSIVPRTPKEVLALKYGDCKDKATLLVAMLRVAGIPAQVALLNAGTDLDIDAELPGLSRFNHVIVRVGGDDPFWVDPTDEYSPVGVLPVSDQDRLVLIADAATTDLVRTPASESTANVTRETRTFLLADEGKSAVTEVTEATGAHESSLRRFAAMSDKKDYREAMETYVKDAYDAKALKDLSLTNPRDLSKPFRLTLEVAEAGRGSTGDIDAAVAIFPSSLVDALPWSLRFMPDDEDEPETPRTRDFVLTTPYVKEFQYRIVPPPGYVARTLPPSETRELGTATLETKYEVAGDGAVMATLRFDSGKRRLTPAEMLVTRKAVSAVVESNAIIIGFDSVGWSALNAGDIGAAIAEFRRLAALHPKEARHHVQVGRAYLVGGMGEIAREEFRRAIALEPDYAPAHRFLGVALQHDLLAREYRKGFDLPGAIAAYRKAKELAPKDADIRSELAKVLSRGTDGELYSEGANLAEAIEEYKSIAADLKDERFEGELLTVMAHARRFDEMKVRARDVKDVQQRMVALVVADAATNGADAALRQAASVDTTTRRSILGTAFPTLLHLRLYPEAMTILEQATLGASTASQVRPLMDVLKRTKRYEELELGDDPKALVARITFLGAMADDVEEALRGDIASWVLKFEDDLKAQSRKETESQSESVITRARLQAQAQGLPLRVATELGFGAMELSQEGSDVMGHRVRLRLRTALPGMESFGQTFYIVKEKDRYVVAGSNNGSVAVTALHFADAGDLESARTWLNWAREEMSAGGGDDPLLGPPFAALWPKAKPSATDAEVRVAAAALLVADQDYAAAAAPLLVAARERVSEAQRVFVDLALATAYMQLDEVQKLLEVSGRVVTAWPDSPSAFRTHAMALSESGKTGEARRLAAARLEKLPNDPDALRVLSHSSASDGDFEKANEYVRRIIERSRAMAVDYNNLAWNALFIGKALDQAIEDANHSVALSANAAAVHTLAALYAEAGNSLEARTKLLESMDLAGREEPSSVDWYVLGRIAENYGATDAALAAYKRVTKPERNISGSTYELTRRRVQSLGKR